MLLTTLRGKKIIPTPTSKVPKFHLSILYIQVPMRNQAKAFSSLRQTGYSTAPVFFVASYVPYQASLSCPEIETTCQSVRHPSMYHPEIANDHLKISTIHKN
ncbi:hypothetical protein PAHAL_4G360000 [Panicum hallii]|jgi:hypothetical protein|uniref:Uncharacterized protein n=1 Tax=Panicum hallii TaxID=206008 RepID=A0A2T8JF70_9POAL|nr:hypothetical protein PAHAL_4G360000 [Panicum hallii]